ncbi:MAG: argininosuccinate synthase [Abitibacteriaceae bacterium]|nr:argininosuccinate synthase [Abditibacteriaceae bacterium]
MNFKGVERLDTVVLAYSGGLDTSVAIKWIKEKYNLDVIALTIDLGSERNLPEIRQRALNVGAIDAKVVDGRDIFVKHFAFPALQAGAIYEKEYPLATAVGRPLIAKLLVDVAHEYGAKAVAHGCTGKGNDQVRLDVSVQALDPQLQIIAPVREWKMSRPEEIEYARQNNIPIPATVDSPYSTDVNLWGRSIEAGILEDPWVEPPAEVWLWTKSPEQSPNNPQYIEIEFEKGLPVALDGEAMDGVKLIQHLNDVAGEHGIGRIDHVENRLIGIKSREIYEAPAAVVLHQAHQALEDMTLSRDQARFKNLISSQIAEMIYNGLWFSALHQDLRAFVESSQRHVTGTVRLKFYKGTSMIVGRKSPKSLYQYELATYDKGDTFDQDASLGFIKLYGLPLRTQATIQMLGPGENYLPQLEGREE